MTINFNWMEHCLEVLMKFLVTSGNADLAHLVIKPMPFRQKLNLLRRLVEAVAIHYVPSKENEFAYADFKTKLKQVISNAEKLNEFRNGVIHWRPFLNMNVAEQKPIMSATAREINVKADAMNEIGNDFFEYAMRLRRGDGALTFGSHLRTETSFVDLLHKL
jgi:hypothetical protein